MSVIEDRRPAAMVSWPESEYKRKSIDLKLEVRNRSETGEKSRSKMSNISAVCNALEDYQKLVQNSITGLGSRLLSRVYSMLHNNGIYLQK